jgi:PST family polysaccharide transporter
MLPITNLTRALAATGIPTFSRLVDDPRRYGKSFINVMRILSVYVTPPLIFTVVFADTLIPLALGEQFAESVTVYRWLALVGIVEAITVPIDWLYVTQNRNTERLRLGLTTCAIALIGFLVGVQYGAVGVAASYGIGGVLLRAPFGIMQAGRRGPLTSADLFASIAVPMGVGAAATGFMFCIRWLLHCESALMENGLAFLLGVTFYLFAYALFPITRTTLKTSITMIQDVFLKRPRISMHETLA